MILHRYFAQKYVFYYTSVFMIFVIFAGMIDFIEHLRKYGDDVAVSQVSLLTLSNVPSTVYQSMPLIMILSGIWLFLALSRSSELVVTRSAGRSPLQFLMAPVLVGLIIGAITVAIFNPLVAAMNKQYSNTLDEIETGRKSAFSVGAEGLWLRQGDDLGQIVIRASRSNSDGTVLSGVTLISLSNDGNPTRRIEAERAQLGYYEWILRNAKIWPIGDGINPEFEATTQKRFTVPSNLTLDQIRNSFGSPQSISIWKLSPYIADLQASGFSARRHAVWFQMELARPLFLVSMLLIGAGFSMRPSRFGGTGLSVLTAVFMGFGLFYMRNFAQILGENGQLPVALAAWTPPIATFMIALGIILHKEDG